MDNLLVSVSDDLLQAPIFWKYNVLAPPEVDNLSHAVLVPLNRGRLNTEW